MNEYRVVFSLDGGHTKTWVTVNADNKAEVKRKILSELMFIEITEVEKE